MNHRILFQAILAVAVLSPVSFRAANAANDVAESVPAAGSELAMSEGEIRKVDKGAGKVTIKHGELKNLNMPPMTMVFRVADPAMLDQAKTGGKVQFIAEKVAGTLTLTKLVNVK
jgi:Cu/Ag efflux protein CusF